MGIESYVVAEMLERLETQGAMLRPHAAEIATSLSKDEFPEARDASAELLRTLDAFVKTTQILRDHVVAHDGMGEIGESLGELALRARGMVLTDQLAALCDALKDPVAREQTRRWFVGRCRVIAELVALVHERIAQIHASWMPYRQDQPQRPGMTEPDRSSLYRTAIRVAQRALCELRDEPELARFLDNGATATDLPEVHQACKRIDLVLGLQLDIEAGRVTGRKPRRSRTPNGVPERP
jgi:hypothetical protein